MNGTISKVADKSGMSPEAMRNKTEADMSRLVISGLFSVRLAMKGWPCIGYMMGGYCHTVNKITSCQYLHPPPPHTRHIAHLVVDSKVANLHCHGDEVHDTVEFILFELFLKIKIFVSTAKKIRGS